MPPRNPAVRKAYNVAYRLTHQEEIKASRAAYYAAHKEEICAHKAAYRVAHKAKVNAHEAAYRITHKAERNAREAAYHIAHKEERNAARAVHRAAHQEQAKASRAAYYAAHKEEEKANWTAWIAAHPEAKQAYIQRRLARKKAAPINDLTPAQWIAIKTHYDFRCVYCGQKPKRLTMDHITPLSKGGSHTLSNIVPACRSCNSRKHAGPVLVPVQPLLL